MIKIVCVGKIKEKSLKELIQEYKKRLSGYTSLEIIEVDDDSCHVKLTIEDIDHKSCTKKRINIKETGRGFEVLKENLDEWISKKTSETFKK